MEQNIIRTTVSAKGHAEGAVTAETDAETGLGVDMLDAQPFCFWAVYTIKQNPNELRLDKYRPNSL